MNSQKNTVLNATSFSTNRWALSIDCCAIGREKQSRRQSCAGSAVAGHKFTTLSRWLSRCAGVPTKNAFMLCVTVCGRVMLLGGAVSLYTAGLPLSLSPPLHNSAFGPHENYEFNDTRRIRLRWKQCGSWKISALSPIGFGQFTTLLFFQSFIITSLFAGGLYFHFQPPRGRHGNLLIEL